MDGKKRVLLLHPDLGPYGGGEAVAAWTLQALRDEYAVSLLAWERPRFDAINRFYGTSLRPSDVEVILPPRLARGLIDVLVALDRDPWSIQRWAYMLRMAKRARTRFDVLVSTYNEADLGGPGIQYIHYPWSPRLYQRFGAKRSQSWSQRLDRVLSFQLRPWRLVSDFSFARVMQNLTLVNSDWTGQAVNVAYGLTPTVVYPPVVDDFPTIPWADRRDGFVCVGRLAGEKHIEQAIDVLAAVRERGHDVHLHVVGKRIEDTGGRAYLAALRRRVLGLSWVSLHEDLPRSAMVQIVAAHRYGIHASPDEPFGIAVAELVKAGCVVFAPDGGGQVEILGHDERLTYANREQAVDKIETVLRDPSEQDSLRADLARSAERFSAAAFMRTIQELVRTHLRESA